MDNLPALSEEEQGLQELLSRTKVTPKFAQWVKLFLDKSNKVTCGNRTQAAFIAYNLDRETQYNSASTIGKENYRKLQSFASDYLDSEGMTPQKILDLIAAHATQGKPMALKMLASISEVYQERPNILVQQNTVNNNGDVITNVQVAPEKRLQIHKDFEEFLNSKYSNQPGTTVPTG